MRSPPQLLQGQGQRFLGLAVAAGLGVGALNVAQVVLFGVAIDAAVAGRFEPWPWLAWLLPVVLVRAALTLTLKLLGHHTGAAVRHRARALLFDKLLALGPGVLGGARTGALVNLGVEGVESLGPYHGLYLPQFLLGLTQPLLVCLVVATMDWVSGLVLLVVVPAIPALLMVVRLRFKEVSERYFATASQLSAQFLDAVQGLTTLKLFNQGPAHGQALAARTEALRADTMRLLLVNQLALFVVDWLFSLGTVVAATVLAVTRFQAGALSFGQAVALLLLSLELSRPLALLGAFFFLGALGRTTLAKLGEVLATAPPAEESPRARAPDSFSPRLRFEDVHVTYGEGDEEARALRGADEAQQDVHHRALPRARRPHQRHLLPGLHLEADAAQGRVLLDGRPLESYPLDWLRRQVAVVSQDTFLFHGTVAENLRLGRPQASQAELEAATRAAQAHDFITALPRGYDTQLGEHGARLSGGQRQRLSIARALLGQAPLIVLDEPTAHVDNETEAALQKAVEALTVGRTVLTIAHRLSTVRAVDAVVVLDEGQVVEAGPPAVLLRARGPFSRLASSEAAPA